VLDTLRSAAAGETAIPNLDIDDLLESVRRKNALPALAAAVVSNGVTIAVGAVGMRKFGESVPVTVRDQFHLGSCTKSMTATVAAMLIEEGKLAWDTTLAQAFPELSQSIHPDLRDVTLEQLLAHRAGLASNNSPQVGSLRSLLETGKLAGTPREQRRAYVEMIVKEKPAITPGARFAYSNRGYAVIGAIMERVAGLSWEELMTRRLFVPLAMTTAGFGAMGRPGKIDQPWQHRWKDSKPQPIEPGPLSDNPAVIGPAGTVHCSVGDWAKYLLAHVRGESRQTGLLKADTFKRLHTAPFGGSYAAGWRVVERDWGGGKVLTHAGSNTQNYAVAWVAPLRDFAVGVMTNQGGQPGAPACDQAASLLIRRFLK
jgi:CubicO group peptidase (beta-lactamase class C family)